jgi:hypothetical protein
MKSINLDLLETCSLRLVAKRKNSAVLCVCFALSAVKKEITAKNAENAQRTRRKNE